MADKPANPLLSGQPSESGLQVILHPLPIISISDLITRSNLRGLSGPIVVALLGQQSGLGITIEESFDCRTIDSGNGVFTLDAEWFHSRLEQMKLVYKQPQLDLVGWGTLVPESGPTADLLPIHQFLLSAYNDAAILLGLHPQSVMNPVGGRLPITIYDSSSYDAEGGTGGRGEAAADGEDKEMRDGSAAASEVQQLRFHELPYSIETGEAEMIGMAFVHKGAANATAATSSSSATAAAASAGTERKTAAHTETEGKGKRRATQEDDNAAPAAPATAADSSNNVVLSHEEQDLLAALGSKKNAIQMLKKRIDLFTTYLQRLPTADTTTTTISNTTTAASGSRRIHPPPVQPNNNILRALQALKTNLGLIAPGTDIDIGTDSSSSNGLAAAHKSQFGREMLREANDVHLVSLLGDVLAGVNEVREVGRQFAIVDAARLHKTRLAEYGGGEEAEEVAVVVMRLSGVLVARTA